MKYSKTIVTYALVITGLFSMLLPVYSHAQGADDPAGSNGRASDGLGKDTLNLLALQSSNKSAGQGVPILGDQETASYKRYLDSFNKPIPDFFTNTIKSSSGS